MTADNFSVDDTSRIIAAIDRQTLVIALCNVGKPIKAAMLAQLAAQEHWDAYNSMMDGLPPVPNEG